MWVDRSSNRAMTILFQQGGGRLRSINVVRPTYAWRQTLTSEHAFIWSRPNHILTMPSDKLQPIVPRLASPVATALLTIFSRISAGWPPPSSTVRKNHVVFVYPVQAAPTPRQNDCPHITDRLRATVPRPTQARGAGPVPDRQGLQALRKCCGETIGHEHPLTLPMGFSTRLNA